MGSPSPHLSYHPLLPPNSMAAAWNHRPRLSSLTHHILFSSLWGSLASAWGHHQRCVWGGLLSFSECGVGAPPLSVSFLQLTRNVLPASHTSPHQRHSATSTSAHLQQETGTLRKKQRTCLFPFSLSLSSVLPLSTRRVFHVRRYRGLPHVGFSILHIMV